MNLGDPEGSPAVETAMRIDFLGTTWDFVPWSPRMGRVFERTYALDCETARIDEERPWLVPPFVLGAACVRGRGVFLTRASAADFLAAHADVPVAMHHATFDLAVLDELVPGLDVYGWVDRDRVWDTEILHRLLTLAIEGHTAGGKGQSTLDRCIELHLDYRLPKDLVDSRGEPVRTSYGRWLGHDPCEIEPIYLEYLAKDAIATHALYRKLRASLKHALSSAGAAWGYVSARWLVEQMRRWGPATHHIQLKAAVVLASVTAAGLRLDLRRRDALLRDLAEVQGEFLVTLREHGYLPDQPGSDRALQAILRNLERRCRGRNFPRTPTGKYATSEEALSGLVGEEPFAKALLDYRAVAKLRSAFLEKMGTPAVRPSFDVLKVTGRTSSFGALNAQNLPRDPRVRRCFVPSEGHVFIDADYSAIEMATLAQSVSSQFGLESRLAAALNKGHDPHRMVAALATGKAEEDVTDEERRRAKPVNFGKPGGMGHGALKAYARSSYGVDLSDSDVEALSESWFSRFPEMRSFLANDTDMATELARHLGLTPRTHCEHTGSRRFLGRPQDASRDDRPSAILGGMCLKTLGHPEPRTRDGRPYDPDTVEFFWDRVARRSRDLPTCHQQAVNGRRPSAELQKAVLRLVDRASVWTLTGRLRAGASFAARHNNVFQGLAADGAKLALWRAWRAGYRIVNFVHDELLVEVPGDSDFREHGLRIAQYMIEGMEQVVPDVRIAVEWSASRSWSKRAEDLLENGTARSRRPRPIGRCGKRPGPRGR